MSSTSSRQYVSTSNVVHTDPSPLRRYVLSPKRNTEAECEPSAQDSRVTPRRPTQVHVGGPVVFVQPDEVLPGAALSSYDSAAAHERTTIDAIESGSGDWSGVPMCVRDTIVRLMRTTQRVTSGVSAASRSASDSREQYNADKRRDTAHVHAIQSSRRLLGQSSRPLRPSAAERQSFIATDGLPRRRSITGAEMLRERAPPSSMSPLVARVLAQGSGSINDTAVELSRHSSPDRKAPKVSNSPFGVAHHHPYEGGVLSVEQAQLHAEESGPAAVAAAAKRPSPGRSKSPQSFVNSQPWRPTGTKVRPYEATEPFGAPDGTAPKQARSLALTNLMHLYDNVEHARADFERFLHAQLLSAMPLDPRRQAPQQHSHSTAQSLELLAVDQRQAFDELTACLRDTSAAMTEVVATYLSDEEKRYLGLHTHKFQTQREKDTRYQYTRSARTTPRASSAAETSHQGQSSTTIKHAPHSDPFSTEPVQPKSPRKVSPQQVGEDVRRLVKSTVISTTKRRTTNSRSSEPLRKVFPISTQTPRSGPRAVSPVKAASYVEYLAGEVSGTSACTQPVLNARSSVADGNDTNLQPTSSGSFSGGPPPQRVPSKILNSPRRSVSEPVQVPRNRGPTTPRRSPVSEHVDAALSQCVGSSVTSRTSATSGQPAALPAPSSVAAPQAPVVGKRKIVIPAANVPDAAAADSARQGITVVPSVRLADLQSAVEPVAAAASIAPQRVASPHQLSATQAPAQALFGPALVASQRKTSPAKQLEVPQVTAVSPKKRLEPVVTSTAQLPVATPRQALTAPLQQPSNLPARVSQTATPLDAASLPSSAQDADRAAPQASLPASQSASPPGRRVVNLDHLKVLDSDEDSDED